MKLGEFILRYRKEHGLSQRQFAMKCGLSNGYIAMIEKGENPKTKKPIAPTLEKLGMIAKGMGLPVNDLVRLVDGDTYVTFLNSKIHSEHANESDVTRISSVVETDIEEKAEGIQGKRRQIIDIIETVPEPILQPLYELIQASLANAQKFDESVRQLNLPKT